MPLPLPALDDQRYQQLIDGMRERLPLVAPQWTEHNASDPGITLLELFAYLGDQLSYLFDRVPARQTRAFLRAIGVEARVARVACAPVVFHVDAAAGPRPIPAGMQLGDESGTAAFQTTSAFVASSSSLVAVLINAGAKWIDETRSRDPIDRVFAPLGTDPQPGDALFLGFDAPLAAAGARLRLFVAGPDLASDFADWDALRAEFRWRRSVAASAMRRCRGARSFWHHYSAQVVWEYFAGHEWRPLESLKDHTRALSLSGAVRFAAPAGHVPGGVEGHEGRYFIRCRLASGGFDCAPRIRAVHLNSLLARHAVDVTGTFTPFRSNGAADQRFRLSRTPVVPGSLRIEVTGANGGIDPAWRDLPDLDRSGAHAREFALDTASGDLQFGDGRTGLVLPAGATLAGRWRVGGGNAGNVPADTLKRIVNGIAGVRVSQPVAARGGADPEMLDAIRARAFRKVRDERCATTLADFERFALQVPGACVARAFAVNEFRPHAGCLRAAGSVTLIIVPAGDSREPAPSDGLCAAVAQFLETRRPLALELHVTGPRYTRVAVHATLALERNASIASVTRSASNALDSFLHPLTGGDDGNGWVVGRAVFRSEILAVLNGVPGVHHVAALALVTDAATPDRCGDLAVCANGLVSADAHDIRTI